MQYRNELKYLISSANYALARARLAPLMKRDAHVNAAGVYTIRSLYFDDLYNSAYNEKYAGVIDRQKFRIRIYNYADHVIHLERKVKRDRHVYKQTARLNRWQVEELLAGRYDWLQDCEDPLLQVFYYECRAKLLRPRAILDYEREPFVMEAGQVRVTFDQHLRVGLDGWDIFNSKMNTRQLLPPGSLIMEVKFSGFLPTLVQQLLPHNVTYQTAASKYVMGCDQILYKRLFDY